MPNSAPAVIRAKDGSAAAIRAALAAQTAQARPGPFGPGPLPMVYIPIAGSAPAMPTRRAAPDRTSEPVLVVAGLASPYGVTVDNGRHRPYRIAAGAFVVDSDVFATIDHETACRPLGTTADGTLRFFDTPAGLRFQLDAMSPAAQRWEVMRRVDSGFFHAASVRFSIISQTTSAGVDTITSALLIEVSLISGKGRAMAPGTHVSIAIACGNCRTHGIEGYVRARRCQRCGMPYQQGGAR